MLQSGFIFVKGLRWLCVTRACYRSTIQIREGSTRPLEGLLGVMSHITRNIDHADQSLATQAVRVVVSAGPLWQCFPTRSLETPRLSTFLLHPLGTRREQKLGLSSRALGGSENADCLGVPEDRVGKHIDVRYDECVSPLTLPGECVPQPPSQCKNVCRFSRVCSHACLTHNLKFK